MRRRNTCAGGGAHDPLLQWFANAIQGEVGQLSAAVIKDGPIWRFPSVKRPQSRMLIIGRCRCLWQRIHDLLELLGRAAGGKPVRNIALVGAAVPMLAN